MEDTSIPTPSETFEIHSFCKAVDSILSSLTDHEAKILRMCFGINMRINYTLEEVSNHFGVTSERIRQIEAKALRKLRSPFRSKVLRDFCESYGKS